MAQFSIRMRTAFSAMREFQDKPKMPQTNAVRIARVGWKVSKPSADIASVRYRALIPILALQGQQVESTLLPQHAVTASPDLDVLVIVKSFTKTDLLLAKSAAQQGIFVVFDLCDNIFIQEYGAAKSGNSPSQMFDLLMAYTQCVVVPSQALADTVKQRYQECRVVVIPDGLDSPELFIRARQWLSQFAASPNHVDTIKKNAQSVWLARVHAFSDPSLDNAGRKRLFIHWLAPRVNKATNTLRRKMSARYWLKIVWTRYDRVRTRLLQAWRRDQASHNTTGTAKEIRILWFGNHGAEHASFGITDLLLAQDALELAATRHSIRLVVCSNHRKKFENLIRPFKVNSEYVEWSLEAQTDQLKQADLVIIPNSLDDFSLCKSANRTTLALLHGIPVVATLTPALQPLHQFIYADDFKSGLFEALSAPDTARSKAVASAQTLHNEFGPKAIASKWHDVIDIGSINKAKFLQRINTVGTTDANTQLEKKHPELLIAVHLIQDLDLALPIALQAVEANVSLEVLCSELLVNKSPRVLTTLEHARIPFRICDSRGAQFHEEWPKSAKALLTVAETNLGPHRWVRSLSDLAREQGAFVCTLQHGFENVGLTYSDEVSPIENVNFRAQRIFTWGHLDTLHRDISPGVRAICVPVGCPKPAHVDTTELAATFAHNQPVVGIFENLHWHRYSESFRANFVEVVRQLCNRNPQTKFIVKPHHAGRWLSTDTEQFSQPPNNLIIVDPLDKAWEPFTAPALFPHLIGVITTPSTVAVDAARAGLPTAVFSLDLELENYLPLTLIQTEAQAHTFVHDLSDPTARERLINVSKNFVDRVIVDGNAAKSIIENIVAAAFTTPRQDEVISQPFIEST